MVISFVNPLTLNVLSPGETCFYDPLTLDSFPIVKGVPRFCKSDNYTDSFGMQWNRFDKIQLDLNADVHNISRLRFFAETHWDAQDLTGQNVLEVGSGAGRFSKVVLESTSANLYSVDYSDAVTANFKNNSPIAPDRFHLFQANVYELPFLNDSFDKVFCMGVLQHTPDFEASVRALISKAKPAGEIVVDFYPINGFWTKLHAKYILRPITKRLTHSHLLQIVEANIQWLISCEHILHRLGLGVLARFLPIVDIKGTIPQYLSEAEKREWVVLDTFDMFSPEYDNPQRIRDVVAMFDRHGADVTFAGFEYFDGFSAAVVRGVKRA
jgi:2-polyprenyl-3-methyl-5-hydroxy-6-metoxy-1,4-benzoquinol methylase